MFKHLTMDIPVPGQNNSKGKKFYLSGSHREGECDKRNSTPCNTPPKVSPILTKYAASISATDILRAGKLVKKEPPTVIELEKFDVFYAVGNRENEKISH